MLPLFLVQLLHSLSHRLSVVVGFSAEAWAEAFDPHLGDVSHYTLALVAALDAQGHDTDITRLLEGLRSSVTGITHGHLPQAPCVYSAKTQDLFLFQGSLVGTSLVSAESSSLTVNGVVLPLLWTFRVEVSGAVSISRMNSCDTNTGQNRNWEGSERVGLPTRLHAVLTLAALSACFVSCVFTYDAACCFLRAGRQASSQAALLY